MRQTDTVRRRELERSKGRLIRGRLFKDDHPRAIDRYIDYFGTTTRTPAEDPCGERLLEAIASCG